MANSKPGPDSTRETYFPNPNRSTPSESEILTTDLETQQRRRCWYRPTVLKAAVAALALLLVVPDNAHGQFGIDTAAILAALSKMQSLMNTYMAKPLSTINQYEQKTAKYEQEVMYPIAAINQAKNSVSQFENQFSRISSMFHVNVSSATLPQSQNLESLLLSRNTANVPAISQSVSVCVWRRHGAEVGVVSNPKHDRYDRCASSGRNEARCGDRRASGRGVS